MPTVNTIVRRGSRNDDVRLLQELLNQQVPIHSLPRRRRLAEDGIFGSNTDTAVRTFQRLNSLSADGIVGQNTWTALGVEYRGTSTTQPPARPSHLPNVPNAPWMQIARGEMGQSEIAGSRHNPRIIEYHATTTLRATSDETAWCSSFVNWCLLQAGITGTNSAGAASWVNWGGSCDPRTGAITVIHDTQHPPERSGNHVAFLIQETGTHFVLLGGNQSNQVRVSRYRKPRWRLRGCRWPQQ